LKSYNWQRGYFGKTPAPDRGFTFSASKSATVAQTKPVSDADYIAYNSMVLTEMPGRTSFAEVNKRTGNEIYCTGIRLQLDLFNDSDDAPFFVEYSIVSPKNGPGVSVNDLTTSLGTDETGANINAAVTAMQQSVNRINPDKYFVFMSKRVMLLHSGKIESGTSDYSYWNAKQGTNFRSLSEWIPIRRSIRFDDETSGTCKDPLFLILRIWRFRQDDNDANVTNSVQWDATSILYYKNTQNN